MKIENSSDAYITAPLKKSIIKLIDYTRQFKIILQTLMHPQFFRQKEKWVCPQQLGCVVLQCIPYSQDRLRYAL